MRFGQESGSHDPHYHQCRGGTDHQARVLAWGRRFVGAIHLEQTQGELNCVVFQMYPSFLVTSCIALVFTSSTSMEDWSG